MTYAGVGFSRLKTLRATATPGIPRAEYILAVGYMDKMRIFHGKDMENFHKNIMEKLGEGVE